MFTATCLEFEHSFNAVVMLRQVGCPVVEKVASLKPDKATAICGPEPSEQKSVLLWVGRMPYSRFLFNQSDTNESWVSVSFCVWESVNGIL